MNTIFLTFDPISFTLQILIIQRSFLLLMLNNKVYEIYKKMFTIDDDAKIHREKIKIIFKNKILHKGKYFVKDFKGVFPLSIVFVFSGSAGNGQYVSRVRRAAGCDVTRGLADRFRRFDKLLPRSVAEGYIRGPLRVLKILYSSLVYSFGLVMLSCYFLMK